MANNKIELATLVEYTNNILQIQGIRDYCPNGLQVQGRSTVSKLVTGVTACQALLDAAVAWQADLVLVHHGYFWKGEAAAITGIKYQRIKTLIKHDISLLAYHLPLDMHPQFGNNTQLGQRLGLTRLQSLQPHNPQGLGDIGKLPVALSLSEFSHRVEKALLRQPLVIQGGNHSIKRVAWCTGAAERFIEDAIEAEVDVYISGEISEPVVHIAREAGIHYISAGHHATERYGVMALGEHLQQMYGLEHQFVDIPNPV